MESNHPVRPGLPVPTPSRPMHRRTDSSSSEASSHASHTSHRSLDSESEDQFVLSPSHTPAHENPPPRVMVSSYIPDSLLLVGKEVKPRPRDAETLRRAPSYLKLTPSSKSRPIAIDLPSGRRRADSIPASEPAPVEPPLSARGDIAGGYFPLHEDPDSRLHIPHPFHTDTTMARRASHQRAAESSRVTASTTSPAPDTPLSSYLPSGHHHDVVLPLGKYYPSNWEKRHGKAPLPHPVHPSTTPPRPATAATTTTTSPSSTNPHQLHRPHHRHHHTDQPRPISDAKRRLQQYQRDMVAQAAMAGNAVLANSPSTATAPSSLGGGGGLHLPKAQLAADLLRAYRPVSPVLRPVGSPGPVTPMSLEQEGDCYLSYGLRSSSGGGGGGSAGGEEEGGEREGYDGDDDDWNAGKGKLRRKAAPFEMSPAAAAKI